MTTLVHPEEMGAPQAPAGRVERVAPLDPAPVQVPVSAEPALEAVEIAAQPEVVLAPVPPPVAEAPEKRYEYQPKDKQGRPLGGKQVIVYRTQDELADKLAAQNEELVRKLREVTRKHRLGIVEDEKLPEDLDRVPAAPRIEKKPLTTEERYALSQDLADPAKFEDARDKLLASAGYDDMQAHLRRQEEKLNALEARASAQVFIERHLGSDPEFYFCPDNMETICDWMIKNGLLPTAKNFEYAYSQTKEAGLLLPPPIVREAPQTVLAPTPAVVPVAPVVEETVPNSQAPTVQVTRISDEVQSQPKSQVRVPSGLNSRVASNTGVVSTTETPALTLAQLERMPSEEYKRRIMTDPSFAKLADELLSKQPPRPRSI